MKNNLKLTIEFPRKNIKISTSKEERSESIAKPISKCYDQKQGLASRSNLSP